MTPQEKLEALQDRSALLDFKFRNGRWWARAVRDVKPRNSDKKSSYSEVEGESLESCLDQLLS